MPPSRRRSAFYQDLGVLAELVGEHGAQLRERNRETLVQGLEQAV